MNKMHLTPEGYEKFKKQLEYLKKVRRRELSKEIGKAREQGDISENAEYAAAKEAQGLNEKHIFELEQKLANAQIRKKTLNIRWLLSWKPTLPRKRFPQLLLWAGHC